MLLGLLAGLYGREKNNPNLTPEEEKRYNRNKMLAAMSSPLGSTFLEPILYQKALGRSQSQRGFEAEKNLVRPTYQRPGEITQALNIQKGMAEEGLSQQAKDYNRMMMDRNVAYSLQQLEGRKAGLAGIGALQQGLQDNAMQLAMQDEAARRANTQAYVSGLQQAAPYSDKEFQINKMQPYEMALQRAMALQGSGLQNIWGAKQSKAQLGKEATQFALGTLQQALGGGLGMPKPPGTNYQTLPGAPSGYESTMGLG